MSQINIGARSAMTGELVRIACEEIAPSVDAVLAGRRRKITEPMLTQFGADVRAAAERLVAALRLPENEDEAASAAIVDEAAA